MEKKRLFMPAALICALAGHAAAEEAVADSVSATMLRSIEVVGTRATETTPIAYTNVTAKQIARANTGVDLPYLLQATPSVICSSDAGAGVGYTSIRVRGTEGSRINVTANGIPVNDAESQNVYWVNIPDIASSLRDVQIQRGSGTSTNGPGAFGASINMQTQSPATTSYAGADAGWGMYGTGRQTLRLGSGLLADRWAVDARLSHIASDGYIDRASSRLWSYFTQGAYYNGGTSVKLLLFGGNERTYQAWDYATRAQIEQYGRRYNPCGEYTASDGSTAYYPDQYDRYTQHHSQLVLNHRVDARWHINAALHYTKGDGYYEQYKTSQKFKKYGLTPYYDGDTRVDRSDLVRLKKMDNGFGGGILSATYTHGALQAVAGGGLHNYRGHHFGQIAWLRNYVGTLDPLQEYYRNKADKLDGNVYAKATLALGRGVSAYADLQYRHIDYSITGVGDNYDDNAGGMQLLDINRHYNFFNPKGGVDYRPTDRDRLYASFSVAHREPARDNFIDCAPGRQPVPERLIDYELGYSRQGRTLSGGVNLYYMHYKDQLLPTGRLSDTGNAVSENVPSSYRMGVEAYWTVAPCRWFDWDFTATLSRNRVNDWTEYIYGDDAEPLVLEARDTPIRMSPSLTAHSGLNLHLGGLDLSLQTLAVSRQYLDNSGSREVSLSPYCVTDLHIGYDLGRVCSLKSLRLSLVVYNLFDKKYESNGWAYAYYYRDSGGAPVVGREAGYAVQAPAHVMGTVSVEF